MAPPRFCQLCGGAMPTHAGRGRPRTTHYPACPEPLEPVEIPSLFHVKQTVPIATPFNSTPVTAPRPALDPTAVHDPGGPGPIELQLISDLKHVETNNPLALTLAQVAIRCARAADLAPADDLKSVLGAVKELRALMTEISKSHEAGGDDDGFDDTPVGSSRPEIRDTPAF